MTIAQAFPSPKSGLMSGVEKRRSDFSLPVAVGPIFTWPPQSGLTWVCFLFPLIELDRHISCIQLSEKGSRSCPRKADGASIKTNQPKLVVQELIGVPFGTCSLPFMFGAQPLAQPAASVSFYCAIGFSGATAYVGNILLRAIEVSALEKRMGALEVLLSNAGNGGNAERPDPTRGPDSTR